MQVLEQIFGNEEEPEGGDEDEQQQMTEEEEGEQQMIERLQEKMEQAKQQAEQAVHEYKQALEQHKASARDKCMQDAIAYALEGAEDLMNRLENADRPPEMVAHDCFSFVRDYLATCQGCVNMSEDELTHLIRQAGAEAAARIAPRVADSPTWDRAANKAAEAAFYVLDQNFKGSREDNKILVADIAGRHGAHWYRVVHSQFDSVQHIKMQLDAAFQLAFAWRQGEEEDNVRAGTLAARAALQDFLLRSTCQRNARADARLCTECLV